MEFARFIYMIGPVEKLRYQGIYVFPLSEDLNTQIELYWFNISDQDLVGVGVRYKV